MKMCLRSEVTAAAVNHVDKYGIFKFGISVLRKKSWEKYINLVTILI